MRSMIPAGSRPGPSGTPICSPELSEAEIAAVFGATVTANTIDGPLTPTQSMVIEAVARSLTDQPLDPARCDVVTPEQLAQAVNRAGTPDRFRHDIVRYMGLAALLLDPVDDRVVERIDSYAVALGIGAQCAPALQRASGRSYQAALYDFARNGYAAEFTADRYGSVLHTSATDGQGGWVAVEDDPALSKRWESLQDCPDGTIGRNVYDFYRSRGFVFPGSPGSTPPLLAQHDWVHVLADYGTTLECELEVFGLISTSDDDRGGFSLLAMIIGLFATGSVDHAAGLFDADPGHLADRASAVRLADGLRRGACATCPDGSRNGGLMNSDWFAVAELPMHEIRRRCNLPDKSELAVRAGSPGT